MKKLSTYSIFIISVLASISHGFDIRGASKQDIERVKTLFPSNTNKMDASTADKIIKFLMGRDTYHRVTTYQNEDGSIYLEVLKNEKIGELKITGNSGFDDQTIMSQLGLHEGHKFERTKVLRAGEKLKEYYGKNGYLNAEIAISFKKSSNDAIEINFEIDKKEQCKISNILVESENETLNNIIQKKITKYVKDPLQEDTLNSIYYDVKKYFKDNRYLKSDIVQKQIVYNTSQTEANLIFKITDPFKFQIIFKGIEELSASEIIRSIDLENFNRGTIDPASSIVRLIRLTYLKKGYPHSAVSYDVQINKSDFTHQVRVNIDEGPRVKVDKIEVKGRISRPSKYYAKFVKDHSSSLIGKGYYYKDDFEKGLKNLITELQNQGYIRAKLQSYRINYLKNKKNAHIEVAIDEGPLTQLRQIEFQGASAFGRLELIDILDLQPNSPLRLNKLEESLIRLKEHYRQAGFIEVSIENEKSDLVQYNAKGSEANLLIKLYEGPKVFVQSILLEGNHLTKDYVILKELEFEKGDLLTSLNIIESRARLAKMGIFTSVDITTLEAGTKTEQRTVLVKVSERNPGVFKFGVGVTNKRGLTIRGFSGVSYRNIGGKARAISTRANLESDIQGSNYLENEVNFSYLEPFLFGKRIKGRIDITRTEEVTNFDEATNTTSVRENTSMGLSLEKDLTSNIKFSWVLWSVDAVRTFQKPVELATFNASTQRIAAIGPVIDIDYRDNPFLPTKGTYTRWEAEYSDPELGSSELIQFAKTEGTFTHYQRLTGPDLIWANSLRGGYITNLSDRVGSGVPSTHAFFLGGIGTIRGFSGNENDRLPRNDELPTDTGNQLVIEKDSNFYLYKSELRFPIYKDIGGVIFYDAGEVTVTGKEFAKPFRQSYGIGLRYNTPLGPISLDYGRKIDRLLDEPADRFHLSIGTF